MIPQIEQVFNTCCARKEQSKANTRENTPKRCPVHRDVRNMRTFVETGYSNTMILDHTPRFVEGYEAAGTGYAIGYMRSCCPNTRWSGRRRS
jgi:hypothetical protein